MLFRPKINGDNNYLSSPILTVNNILNDPILPEWDTFVDIGCGEGIVGIFTRLIKKKTVILHDIQSHFLRMISVCSKILFIFRIKLSDTMLKEYPKYSIFYCVWTSWSTRNRLELMSRFQDCIPKGSILITVSHAVDHPSFSLLKRSRKSFAWGDSTVYYYRHD